MSINGSAAKELLPQQINAVMSELTLTRNSSHKNYVTAFILFLVTLVWLLLLIQGLPMNDLDDWDHVLAAKDLSWNVLMKNMSIPWSKSLYWDGQSDRMNEVTHRRTFLTVALKSVHSIFGFQPFPLFLFTKAFIFTGSVTLLFLLLVQMTQNRILSLGGVLFYSLVPAHYIHVLWLTDPVTMVHFFILCALWNYTSLHKNLQENGSFADFGRRLSILTFWGWLAMKTKEPAVILPISLFVYQLFHLKDWQRQKVKRVLLFAVLGWLMFLLVPIEHLGARTENPLKFNPEIVFRMYFKNYDCGFDNEPVSAFFSREHLWPVSIARTFKFYLLWMLVLCILIYVLKRLRTGKTLHPLFIGHPLVSISIVWLLAEIFFMGRFQPDPRYFSGTMIPLTILSVRLIQCTAYQMRGFLRVSGLSLLIFSLSTAVFENLQHIFFLRLNVGKRGRFFFETAKTIYQDVYPNEPYDLEKILLSGAAAYVPSPDAPRIKDHIFYSPFGYGMWKKTDERTVEAFEKFSKDGAIYDVSYEDERLPPDPRIKHIATISEMNQESWLESILYPLKGKKVRHLYIDKWVGS